MEIYNLHCKYTMVIGFQLNEVVYLVIFKVFNETES
jgi:hypothetical protein